MATDTESEDNCGRPTEQVAISHLASGDWDDSLEEEQACSPELQSDLVNNASTKNTI